METKTLKQIKDEAEVMRIDIESAIEKFVRNNKDVNLVIPKDEGLMYSNSFKKFILRYKLEI